MIFSLHCERPSIKDSWVLVKADSAPQGIFSFDKAFHKHRGTCNSLYIDSLFEVIRYHEPLVSVWSIHHSAVWDLSLSRTFTQRVVQRESHMSITHLLTRLWDLAKHVAQLVPLRDKALSCVTSAGCRTPRIYCALSSSTKRLRELYERPIRCLRALRIVASLFA